jgi:hypothetical protein
MQGEARRFRYNEWGIREEFMLKTAVRERVRRNSALELRRHEIAFETTSMLSRAYDFPDPKRVLQVLVHAKVDFVLVGAHGISGWTGKHRGTEDVDVVVKPSHHKRALQAMLKEFPHLRAKDLPVVTRIFDPSTEQVFVDLMKPKEPLYKVVFKHSIPSGDHRIPTLEMALASKFAAMVSAWRDRTDKGQDGVDFQRLVLNNKTSIRRAKLKSLGDLVYPQGGSELLKLVDDALAGRRLSF